VGLDLQRKVRWTEHIILEAWLAAAGHNEGQYDRQSNKRTKAPANDQRHHKKKRSSAVAKIADRTGCQWHWRSSKVNDFHLIWQGVCHFLLMINSNLDAILHRLATVHLWQTDGQTYDNHGNSLTVTKVRSAKNYVTLKRDAEDRSSSGQRVCHKLAIIKRM